MNGKLKDNILSILIILVISIILCIVVFYGYSYYKMKIDSYENEIADLKSERDRYKMISEDYEELFMNCVESS